MKKISFLAFACVLGTTFYSAQAASLVSGGSGSTGAMVARAGSLRVNTNSQPTVAPTTTSGAETTRIAVTAGISSRIKPINSNTGFNTGSNIVPANNTNNTNYVQLQVAIKDVEDSLNALKNVLTTTEAMANEALRQSTEAASVADEAGRKAAEATSSAAMAELKADEATSTALAAKEFANNSPAVEALRRANDQAEEISGLKVSLTEQLNELKNQKIAFEQEVAANNELRKKLDEKFNEVSANLKKLDEATVDLAQQMVSRPSDEEFKKQINEVNQKIDTVSEIAVKTQNGLDNLNSVVGSVGNDFNNIGFELGNKASKESVDKLVEEMYSLRADIDKAQNTADSAQQTADSAKEDNGKWSEQLVSLSDTWEQRRKEDNDKFQKEIDKANENNDSLTSRVKKNEDDIKQTSEDFSDFKNGETGRISALVKDSVETGIKDSATISELSQKVGKVESDTNTLKTTGSKLVNRMNNMETVVVPGLSDSIANNAKNIETNAAGITANNSQFQNFFTGNGSNSLYGVLTAQANVYDTKINAVNEELTTMSANVTKQGGDIDALNGTVGSLNNSVTTLTGKVSTLETNLNGALNDINSIQADMQLAANPEGK